MRTITGPTALRDEDPRKLERASEANTRSSSYPRIVAGTYICATSKSRADVRKPTGHPRRNARGGPPRRRARSGRRVSIPQHAVAAYPGSRSSSSPMSSQHIDGGGSDLGPSSGLDAVVGHRGTRRASTVTWAAFSGLPLTRLLTSRIRVRQSYPVSGLPCQADAKPAPRGSHHFSGRTNNLWWDLVSDASDWRAYARRYAASPPLGCFPRLTHPIARFVISGTKSDVIH